MYPYLIYQTNTDLISEEFSYFLSVYNCNYIRSFLSIQILEYISIRERGMIYNSNISFESHKSQQSRLLYYFLVTLFLKNLLSLWGEGGVIAFTSVNNCLLEMQARLRRSMREKTFMLGQKGSLWNVA